MLQELLLPQWQYLCRVRVPLCRRPASQCCLSTAACDGTLCLTLWAIGKIVTLQSSQLTFQGCGCLGRLVGRTLCSKTAHLFTQD